MAYIAVDLDQFDDEDIVDEYHARGLAEDDPRAGALISDVEVLNRIWVHDREGRKDEAYALMREYVLEKLNKVV